MPGALGFNLGLHVHGPLSIFRLDTVMFAKVQLGPVLCEFLLGAFYLGPTFWAWAFPDEPLSKAFLNYYLTHTR